MTGVAGHFIVAIESCGVDAANHLQHPAGGYLPRFFIAVESSDDVAIAAFQPRSGDEGAHYGANLFRLENLEVFRSRHCAHTAPSPAARRTRRRSILTEKGNGAYENQHGKKSGHVWSVADFRHVSCK